MVGNLVWEDLGCGIVNATDLLDAMHQAGIDWSVTSCQLVSEFDGELVPNVFNNYRQSDGQYLGTVSGRYCLWQNISAFDFVKEIANGRTFEYVRGGDIYDGRVVWLVAKLPGKVIEGDWYDAYMCFTNFHDGKGSIKATIIPVLKDCSTIVNMEVKGAVKKWNARHLQNLNTKMADAAKTLKNEAKYMDGLEVMASAYNKQFITEYDVNALIMHLFPIRDSARAEKNASEQREELRKDIAEMMANHNSKWGVILGVANFMSHSKPERMTAKTYESRFANVIFQETILDKAVKFLDKEI